MWPAQYRHGVALAPGMAQAMEDGKIFHQKKKAGYLKSNR
jgi:hypothetical protein